MAYDFFIQFQQGLWDRIRREREQKCTFDTIILTFLVYFKGSNTHGITYSIYDMYYFSLVRTR